MNITQLVPAYQLAQSYGVKAVGYGPPGSGKTPLLDTLKPYNPVLGVTEPGMLSMRHSGIACFPAFTAREVTEYVDWCVGSHEAKQFGVKCLDSISQMAEMDLEQAKGATKDGRKIYGILSEKVMERLLKLYYAKETHVVLIAKESKGDGSKDGTPASKTAPYFPGQDLNVKVPHLFDWVFRLEYANLAGVRTRAIRSIESHEYFARERTGRLAEHERPDLAYLINKLIA